MLMIFIIDFYFDFDWSSEGKSILAEFWNFCDQEFSKVIKFHSFWWLVFSGCLMGAVKPFFCKELFPILRFANERKRGDSGVSFNQVNQFPFRSNV